MTGLLEGKVIIVTGAGNGVGKGIALEAARQGAKVIVNDLGVSIDGSGVSQGPAQLTVDEILAFGGTAAANTNSVAEWNSAQSIIEQALDLYGRIDGVVNNAGNLRDGIFHKMSEEDFDAVIKVHLKGSFNMSRAAAPHFKEQESGAFVHMTSTSGLIGNFGQANYCSAKMGIVGLSKSIALDMQRFNVRSNCIAPFAFTRMVGTIPSDTPEGAERLKVNQRMEAAKIAPFTCALLTESAKDVSGQIFGVRNNEIYLFSQPRPIRSAHDGQGWTVESCVERAIPMLRPSFFALDRSKDIFSWDPV
ncbi:SDR family NAD(P)-dependent oxidoreductase [Pseudomonas marginalis]|uniref:SDR family NAD(P)-dependent oxidoreductase n=1 Tax=Pseudomonas marginalis TaxID=298 RepID=A0A9X9BPP1_PSEMA|nr:SDR family NAD(P)-dependent oxidoreductase [Pseudomonas marginalis]TWR56196.1 SDR family NAD(P)-dependent oxidoreductase [Pseudomonas marginalis]SEB60796.1 NAD(P)-dependent dehydrogenase, short-chain alcohol dehydrogenase family [Pseudomonas marginalis]